MKKLYYGVSLAVGLTFLIMLIRSGLAKTTITFQWITTYIVPWITLMILVVILIELVLRKNK